jgi:hypothetical protein
MSQPIIAKGVEYRGHDIVIVNPGDADWTKHRFILWFGQIGTSYVMVWADCLQDALDEAFDSWVVDHAPGHDATEMVNEEGARLLVEYLAEGMSEEDAQEKAWEESCVDMTPAGGSGGYVESQEWGCVCEDPSRDEVLDLLGRTRDADKAVVRRLAHQKRDLLASRRPGWLARKSWEDKSTHAGRVVAGLMPAAREAQIGR